MRQATLITPTHNRPKCMALCEKWVSRQTFCDFEWLVCNSGTPLDLSMGQEQCFVPYTNPVTSFRDNLLCGLTRATGEWIFFIEDDDWYSPSYLFTMLNEVDGKHIYGEGLAKYYHLPTQTYKTHHNQNHASLCQTVIHRSVKDWMINYLSNSNQIYVDLHMWRHAPFVKKVRLTQPSLCVGMKGLYGKGLGNGHKRLRQVDRGYQVLRSWIGDDVDQYVGFSAAG